MALSTVARRALSRSMTSTATRSVFTLPDLPYGYGELEPVISGEIMETHHQKHHQTYVTNLNNAMDALGDAQAKGDVTKIVQLQQVIKFNGGGHLNHSIFWQNLAPPSKGGGGEPTGELAKLINQKYGSFAAMKHEMTKATVAVQGSGWGWLGYDAGSHAVTVATCFNQDPLEATTGLVPLFGIDVWEHAYYLQYKNMRPNYVEAIWQLTNWEDVAARMEAAKPSK